MAKLCHRRVTAPQTPAFPRIRGPLLAPVSRGAPAGRPVLRPAAHAPSARPPPLFHLRAKIELNEQQLDQIAQMVGQYLPMMMGGMGGGTDEPPK